MTKLGFATHPYLLGFDHLERLVERTARTSNDGYPPYNIEQTGADGFRITLAVAGFRDEDLTITVENRQLLIRGRTGEEDGARTYLHRGIAARQFQRAFVLAEGVEVAGAGLAHGLLNVDLQRSEPESVVKTITIETGRKAGA
jgi:HSP20 family molecular chaperone IbpA